MEKFRDEARGTNHSVEKSVNSSHSDHMIDLRMPKYSEQAEPNLLLGLTHNSVSTPHYQRPNGGKTNNTDIQVLQQPKTRQSDFISRE